MGKRDCLQIGQPADPCFCYLNVYCSKIVFVDLYFKVLCPEAILISLVLWAGVPSCSGLPL